MLLTSDWQLSERLWLADHNHLLAFLLASKCHRKTTVTEKHYKEPQTIIHTPVNSKSLNAIKKERKCRSKHNTATKKIFSSAIIVEILKAKKEAKAKTRIRCP